MNADDAISFCLGVSIGTFTVMGSSLILYINNIINAGFTVIIFIITYIAQLLILLKEQRRLSKHRSKE